MSEFQGSPFGHSESLYTTTASGRFFVPKDSEYEETPRRSKIIFLAVAIVLLLAIVTFFILQACSFGIMLHSADLNPRTVTYIVKQDVNDNDNAFTVFKAGTTLGDRPTLVYAERNFWGFWDVVYKETAEEDGGPVGITWSKSAFGKRYGVNDPFDFEWEVHRFYCGSDAVKLIEIDPEQLPANTTVNIQQSGNTYRIHTITFESGGVSNSIDFEQILRENGCIE